jgi:hypothetical protein
MAPGDGGLTSTVAKAGAPVSPALISPPRPLDLLRACGLSLLSGPERGVNLSLKVVARGGKASVLAASILETYGDAD